MVENVEVVESLGSSNHNSIEFSVITQVQLKESVPDFRRANFQAFRSYFAAIEWRVIWIGKRVEDQEEGFSQLLLNACDKFIPRCKRHQLGGLVTESKSAKLKNQTMENA